MKEEKEHILDAKSNDSSTVFIFEDQNALYSFLISNGVDVTDQTLKDIIDVTLIKRKFKSGELIIHKKPLRYFVDKVSQKESQIIKIKNKEIIKRK